MNRNYHLIWTAFLSTQLIGVSGRLLYSGKANKIQPVFSPYWQGAYIVSYLNPATPQSTRRLRNSISFCRTYSFPWFKSWRPTSSQFRTCNSNFATLVEVTTSSQELVHYQGGNLKKKSQNNNNPMKYDAVKPGLPTFRRNILPPISESNNKPSNQSALAWFILLTWRWK
jgi:hypothetical protein